MKRCLFLSIILFPTLAYAQVDLEADLSKYYQEAKASFIANDYLLSIKYLDSSLIQYSDDSLEVIFALYQYATNLERLSKFDSAMRCYERAIPMAKAYQKSKIPIWYGLMQRGVHYQANEQLTLSNKDLLECISIHQPEAKLSAYRLGWAYRTLSYNYLRKSRLDTAHILIDQMMKCAEEANNFNLTKETFLMKGYYLYEIGDLEGALEQFQAKFDFMGLDVKNLDLLHSHDVQNLAIMYQAIGDLERAEEYFLAVDQFHRNEGYREKRSFYQNLQGMIELYLTKEDYERVIQYGEEFFEVYSKMKSVYLDAFYYEILAQKGRAFAGLRQWNKSQDAFEKSLTFYETMPDNNMYLSLIGMYYGEALEKQGDLVNALKQSLKALEIYRKLDGLQSQYAMVCFKDIAKVYESIGNFDLAMTYRDSAIWVNDRNDLLDGKSSGTVRYAQPLTAVLIEKLLLLQKLWHSNPDEMYLTLALKTIDKTNEAINYARKTIKVIITG